MIETAELVIIGGIVFAVALKTIGLYYAKREEGERFKPEFAITAIMGIFVAYIAFAETASYNMSYVNMFMESVFFGLGANLMFDVPMKMIKK